MYSNICEIEITQRTFSVLHTHTHTPRCVVIGWTLNL